MNTLTSQNNVSDIVPSIIARKWRRIGYRVRARVINLLAAKNGKKSLREGTALRLRNEIIADLAWLSESKKANAYPEERLRAILHNVLGKQQRFWKGKIHMIDAISSIPESATEIEFIQTFLEQVMHIRSHTIANIIANPSFTASLQKSD